MRAVAELAGHGSVASGFVVHIIMAHIYIEHIVFFIGPHHRVITAMPNFVRLGAGA